MKDENKIHRLAYEYALREFPNGNTGVNFENCVKDYKNGMIKSYEIDKEETLKKIKDVFNKTNHTGEAIYKFYLDLKKQFE